MRHWRSIVFPRRVPPQMPILHRHVHCTSESINRTPIIELLEKNEKSSASHDITTAVVCGWVKSVRRQKNISFITINDGSSLHSLQVVCDSKNVPSENMDRVSVGSSVKITGDISHAPKSGQVEVQAMDVHVFGTSDASTYPLSKKYHSLEFVREHLHLRPRTNTFGAVTRVRNALSQGLHAYFQSEGFIHVHTPILTSIDCEGAGEQFRVERESARTAKDEEEDEKRAATGPPSSSSSFFGRPAYLTVSGQLHAEMYACALSKVYAFGPTFRAENSNTTRHLAEFWMVEPEMAFAGLPEIMHTAEGAVQHAIQHTVDTCPDDLEFLHFNALKRKEKSTTTNSRIMTMRSPPPPPHHHHHPTIDSLQRFHRIPRMTYTEAISVLQATSAKDLKSSRKYFDVPPIWGGDLTAQHERYLTDCHVEGPVFVTDYPAVLKPFYMRQNEEDDVDGRTTVAGMDLLVPGVGELVGGSVREERLDVLMRNMQSAGLKHDYVAGLDWYMDLRRYGTVPHAGWGMGFERLLLFVTGMENIRDALPVPRYPANCRL